MHQDAATAYLVPQSDAMPVASRTVTASSQHARTQGMPSPDPVPQQITQSPAIIGAVARSETVPIKSLSLQNLTPKISIEVQTPQTPLTSSTEQADSPPEVDSQQPGATASLDGAGVTRECQIQLQIKPDKITQSPAINGAVARYDPVPCPITPPHILNFKIHAGHTELKPKLTQPTLPHIQPQPCANPPTCPHTNRIAKPSRANTNPAEKEEG